MEFPVDFPGIGMNDTTNLALYAQLMRFATNTTLEEVSFENPNESQKRMIHSWAVSSGSEFENDPAS
ncbi:hypothetical protein G7Y89_g8349 [Cudoniella acicularis]|uniref:Uncharacterized protein n=1 Tax=Cudoniella acicularis TaxID=354080 RepID=A0A8H4RGQ6_9HELO|nr:hypothetical protein G7Y89_g8349 [Cudoniella acicularis]